MWLIGPELGAAGGGMLANSRSKDYCPTDVRPGAWQYYDIDRAWVKDKSIGLVCDNTKKCQDKPGCEKEDVETLPMMCRDATFAYAKCPVICGKCTPGKL